MADMNFDSVSGSSSSISSLLHTLIDTVPSLIFVKDAKGRFLFVNQALADIYGDTKESLLGKTDADYNENLDEVQWYNKDDQYVIQNRKEIFIPQEKVTGIDGKTEWYETIKLPIDLGNGEVSVLGVATNITKRKELFEQLSQSQKMDAIGQLAGGIAHDFNNLLTVVLGSASLINEVPDDPDAVLQASRNIEKAATQAAELNQKLLGFAKKGKYQNVAINLNQLIAETAELLERTLEDNITIKLDLKETPAINGDPVQMQQMILNLAINARDAMTESKGGTNGGVLKISTEVYVCEDPRYLQMQPGQYVKIAFKDSGCGIDESVMCKIFEPFFTTKSSCNGTGMGLSMVFGIVGNHGGKIFPHSIAGEGSTFNVYLPVASESVEVEQEVKDSKNENLKKAKLNILLVDDNLDLLDVGKVMLKRLGHDVTTATDGEQAIAIIEQDSNLYDLLIIDMVMPGMSIFETIEALRKSNQELKIIVSTGYDRNEQMQSLIEKYHVTYLAKPYRLERLQEIIKEAIQA